MPSGWPALARVDVDHIDSCPGEGARLDLADARRAEGRKPGFLLGSHAWSVANAEHRIALVALGCLIGCVDPPAEYVRSDRGTPRGSRLAAQQLEFRRVCRTSEGTTLGAVGAAQWKAFEFEYAKPLR